jgi:hypothetical protein
VTDHSDNLPIQPSLVQDTQALAKELKISWSRLITLALQDFVRRYRRPTDLVAQINAAHAEDVEDDEEMQLRQRMRASHRNLVEGEWY